MTSHVSAQKEVSHAHLHLLTTMVLFGSAFTSSKVLVAAVPHEVAAALRFGGGALVLLVLLLVVGRRRSRAPFTRTQVLRAAGVGLFEAIDVITLDAPESFPPNARVVAGERRRLPPDLRKRLEEAAKPPKQPGLVARIFGRRRPNPSGTGPHV